MAIQADRGIQRGDGGDEETPVQGGRRHIPGQQPCKVVTHIDREGEGETEQEWPPAQRDEEEDDGDREGWGGERDSATGDECTTPPPGEPLMARPHYGGGEGMKAF